jgi:integrase
MQVLRLLAAPRSTVASVIDCYLSTEAGHTSTPRTLAERTRLLTDFKAQLNDTPITDCKPILLRAWATSHTTWQSDWTIRRAMATVQTCFHWAVRNGLTDRNPFAGVTHRVGQRGRPMEDNEYRLLLRSTDARFRRVLLFLRYTGARPGEMTAATWKHFDPERGTILLKEHKTARTRRDGRPRVIVLHPIVLRLLAWLRRHYPRYDSSLLLNKDGKRWTRSALGLRIWRLRKKCGLPKECKLYGLRHVFGTRAILSGNVDLSTLAELMGHSTTRMTEHYVHLAGKVDHLRGALVKVFSNGT